MYTLSTISVTGPDALEFLQGQLTNDLQRLDAEAEILAAWCNPKGRVIWFGALRRTKRGYNLSAPAETASAIVKGLTVFRFRSRVEFEVVDQGARADPGFLIKTGFPFIGAAQAEKFTAHMLNLDLLDAVSFNKGCYTGQEIIARTHYKGATKRRTMRFEADEPLQVGARISDGNRDVGEVLNIAGCELLAIVPVDSADKPLSVGSVRLLRQPLPYM